MLKIFVVMGVLGLVAPAIAKEHTKQTSKESGAAPQKVSTIGDAEATKCILQRLVDATGVKDWKIELKELAGTSRNFVATSGSRSEHGTVNVARNYPNGGALRVYLVPKD
jgi:hypothetical protein